MLPPQPREVLELKVAKSWRLRPEEWRAVRPDDRAQMMAYEMYQATIEQYDREFRAKWRKANPKADPEGSTGREELNDYQRLKSLMK